MVHTPKAFGHKQRQSMLADLLRPSAEVGTPDNTKRSEFSVVRRNVNFAARYGERE